MDTIEKIGLGGGCHWCTEAVFQSLKGVMSVEQGYIRSMHEHSSFSEGVIVSYNSKTIDLKLLIQIHLITHKSAVNHSMRTKYRSAVYTFSEKQKRRSISILNTRNSMSEDQLVTRVLDFQEFKPSREEITNYYFKNPEKPFCKTFINPKLQLLLTEFSHAVNHEKLKHLTVDQAF